MQEFFYPMMPYKVEIIQVLSIFGFIGTGVISRN